MNTNTYEIQTLQEYTDELLRLLSEANNVYKQIKLEEERASDFYTDVKPFADNVFKLATKWKEQMTLQLETKPAKYLHLQQIESTYDNLLFVAIQAFQKDTRSKRFHEMVKSIEYVLSATKSHLSSLLE